MPVSFLGGAGLGGLLLHFGPIPSAYSLEHPSPTLAGGPTAPGYSLWPLP